MATINRKIKDFRKRKGYTQAYMAKRMGISQGAYSQFENTESDSMRVKTLKDFCQVFGISADELLDLEPYKQQAEPETAED